MEEIKKKIEEIVNSQYKDVYAEGSVGSAKKTRFRKELESLTSIGEFVGYERCRTAIIEIIEANSNEQDAINMVKNLMA